MQQIVAAGLRRKSHVCSKAERQRNPCVFGKYPLTGLKRFDSVSLY